MTPADAKRTAAEVATVVRNWRLVATSPEVGLTERELDAFKSAFEHPEAEAAQALTG